MQMLAGPGSNSENILLTLNRYGRLKCHDMLELAIV